MTPRITIRSAPPKPCILKINPDLSKTCAFYKANFLKTPTGYRTNPSPTSECTHFPDRVAEWISLLARNGSTLARSAPWQS
ncbi:hypothetical protein B9Z19DRAFT_735149 [Tuber borchii]|uniref:Uncharacterized protein n=1 Tax=Tuber borchii TaxID=42251 RepID=A0A2T6ZY58_TUBBO|nr:hypothetical protein B9Z19DRAFT_735149 [Tuber borchii]